MPVRRRNAGDRRGQAHLGVMAALVLALAISGCASSPKAKPPAETLRIGVFQAIDYLPYYVMVDRGYAAREGLRFKETEFRGGAAVLTALNDGTVDLGEAGIPPLVTATQQGIVPAKAVVVAAGGFVTPTAPFIGVLASPQVHVWGDLAGRPMAINAKSSLGAITLEGRLLAEQVAPVKQVELPYQNMGLAVRSGDVVAATMIEPYLTQSLLRKDGHLLGWVLGGVPVERAETAAWVFSTEFTRTRPAVVKAFLRAYLDAVAWMNANDSQARDLLARHLSLSPEVTRQLHLPLWKADGRNDPKQIAVITDLMTGMQRAPAIPSSRFYDESLLGAVLKER